jgi:hypothetical protein
MLLTTVAVQSTPGSRRGRLDGYEGKNVSQKLARTAVWAQLALA